MADDDDDYKKYGKAVKGETKAAAATRKAKFYTGQRKSDESKATRGDSSAGEELMSIGRKRGGAGGKRDQQIGARARLGMGQKESDARNAGSAPGTLKARIAGVVPGMALGGIGEAAEAAGPLIGRTVKGVLGKMIPESEGMTGQGARKAISSAKSLSGGKTAAKASTKGAKTVSGRYEAAGTKRASETARQQKGSLTPRRVGSQKALPAAKGEAPKMQHAKVRAGSSRSQQSTPRNAGTNPRAARSGKMKAAQKAGKATESKDMLSTLKESVRQAKAKKQAT